MVDDILESTPEDMNNFMESAFDDMETQDAPEETEITEIEAPDSVEVEDDVEAVEDEENTTDEVDEVDEEAVEESDDSQAITPPQSMSAKDREAFYKLPPDQQAWLSDRAKEQESSLTKKSMELADKSKSFESLEAVIGPRREQLAMQGMDESTAIGQLFALSDYANSDPLGFVTYLLNQRGIPLSDLTNNGGTAPTQAANPQLTAVQQELNALKNNINQQTQTQQHQQSLTIKSDIDAFSKDPEFAFYEELQSDMVPIVASLRQSNPGLSNKEYLAKAYKAASVLNDDVSAKIAVDKNAKTEAERIAKVKATANKAKKAGSTNVRKGASLPQGAAKAKNQDDFISALYDERMTG